MIQVMVTTMKMSKGKVVAEAIANVSRVTLLSVSGFAETSVNLQLMNSC